MSTLRLIPLDEWNYIINQRRRWEPFRGWKNGLACPACGGELDDTHGGIIENDSQGHFRKVECKNSIKIRESEDGKVWVLKPCTFTGRRLL